MTIQVLIKTYEAIERHNDRFQLRRTVSAIEAAYADEQSGLVVGQCKSALESICKSILAELAIDYEADIKIQRLAKKCLKALEVAPGVENERKARDAFNNLITSYTHSVELAAQALGALRNDFCPLAHGRSAHHKPLDFFYADLIARQTDAVVSFIHELYVNYRIFEPALAIQDNPGFNEFVDESHEQVAIFEDIYLPHEILFNLKPVRYRSALREYQENEAELKDDN
jgi:hypothetical protein